MIDAALERAFTKSHGTNLLDSDAAQQNPMFTSNRAKLRSSNGGAAIRPLANHQLFLSSMCNVVPQLIDHADSEGNITPGLFPSLESVVGKRSFDHANNDNRWAIFLASGSTAAEEFASEYNKTRAGSYTMV